MLTSQTNAAHSTILVVDDSPDMRRYLRILLELDRYQVETAGDGHEALRRLDEGCSPALVLLDLQMPGLNGIRTLRRIRKQHPDLKVIICSGEDNPRKLRLAIALGAQAYVTKPVQHLYLSAAVERCLGGAQANETSQSATMITLVPPCEAGDRAIKITPAGG
jgi:CheY-like chemotaxis protein